MIPTTIPTTARISPDRPITPKNSSSSWLLSRISRARSRPKKKRESFHSGARFPEAALVSRQPIDRLYFRLPLRRARGEEFGSGTCMHRTGGTTRNVNSSLIEMPRKDSPFNRDPNDKFLFPRVISCPYLRPDSGGVKMPVENDSSTALYTLWASPR